MLDTNASSTQRSIVSQEDMPCGNPLPITRALRHPIGAVAFALLSNNSMDDESYWLQPYKPRIPNHADLVQFRRQKGSRLQQLQQKQGIGRLVFGFCSQSFNEKDLWQKHVRSGRGIASKVLSTCRIGLP